MVAFGVSVLVGLAPLLGYLPIPLFTNILDILPINLRDRLVPFAAVLMGFPALVVQFFGAQHVLTHRLLVRWFMLWLFMAVIMAVVLFTLYSLFTVDVTLRGGEQRVYFIVGSAMLPECECVPARLKLKTCIKERLSVSPDNVDECFDDRELRVRKLLVSLPYLLLMMSLGGAVSTIVLKEAQRKRTNQPPSP
jgi:hypothetical protein